MNLLVFCTGDAAYGVPALHTLAQQSPLIAGRYRFVAMPKLLLNIRLVLASPLLEKLWHVGDRLVIASRIAFSEAFSVCTEHLLAPVGFERMRIHIVPAIHHL